MDIMTHAVVGAATGAVFGNPILGVVIAVMPDVVLGPSRRQKPNAWYNLTHAPIPMLVLLTVVFLPFGYAACAAFAYLSHIVLDLPTHGGKWAPKLFAPFSYRRVSLGDDWEFFSREWWVGLIIASLWSFSCLSLLAR